MQSLMRMVASIWSSLSCSLSYTVVCARIWDSCRMGIVASDTGEHQTTQYSPFHLTYMPLLSTFLYVGNYMSCWGCSPNLCASRSLLLGKNKNTLRFSIDWRHLYRRSFLAVHAPEPSSNVQGVALSLFWIVCRHLFLKPSQLQNI